MRPETIFVPACVLALWTMAVALLVGVRRAHAGRTGRLPPNAFRVGEAPGVPEEALIANRNYMNLLEAPVLFYVVVIAFYVTHHVTSGSVTFAWVFVALRLLHSAVHLTSNRASYRLTAFVLSNVVLVSMWLYLLCAIA